MERSSAEKIPRGCSLSPGIESSADVKARTAGGGGGQSSQAAGPARSPFASEKRSLADAGRFSPLVVRAEAHLDRARRREREDHRAGQSRAVASTLRSSCTRRRA